MTITIEEVKRLNAERTGGEWAVHLYGSVFSVRADDVILAEEPSAGFSLKLTKDESMLPVDLDLMAAAPSIAQLAIDLYEENVRLREVLTRLRNDIFFGGVDEINQLIDDALTKK